MAKPKQKPSTDPPMIDITSAAIASCRRAGVNPRDDDHRQTAALACLRSIRQAEARGRLPSLEHCIRSGTRAIHQEIARNKKSIEKPHDQLDRLPSTKSVYQDVDLSMLSPKERRAVQLRVQGWSYEQISIVLGYKNKSSSQRLIEKAGATLRKYYAD